MDVAGVIIAAGYGTRFLPFTKTVAKELLPLIDRPAVDFIVAEMIESGIRDILVITSRRKKALEDYLDREVELETVFQQEKAHDKLRAIQPPRASIFFRRQDEMKGTGHAICLAQSFVGDRPFVVAYPDDLCLAPVPLCRQLIEAHQRCGHGVLAVTEKPDEDVSRYGVIDADGEGPFYRVRRFVEKPDPGEEPSHLVSFGRFLLTRDVFPLLQKGLRDHRSGEYYHVDAINDLVQRGQLSALDFQGQRLDLGTPLAYLESLCTYALQRVDLADAARDLFRRLS